MSKHRCPHEIHFSEKCPRCADVDPALQGDGISHLDNSNDKGEADRVYASGAHRSSELPLYSAAPYLSLRRLALRATGAPRGETLRDAETGFTYEGGSRKYGYGNWSKGLPFEDTFNHVIEHLLRWRTAIERGEVPKDDDLAAAAWGIMLPLMTFEREYANQHTIRRAFGKHSKAEETDEYMDHLASGGVLPAGYLLRPLAPEKPKE